MRQKCPDLHTDGAAYIHKRVLPFLNIHFSSRQSMPSTENNELVELHVVEFLERHHDSWARLWTSRICGEETLGQNPCWVSYFE